MTNSVAAAELNADAERIRRSGVLGRPGQLSRLFDYLAARSADADPPSETEIAGAVFNRGREFVPGQDAVVRVNIHRLRKRLDDFYLRYGGGPDRLSVPRGEYRLVVDRGAIPPTAAHSPDVTGAIDPRPVASARVVAEKAVPVDTVRPAHRGGPRPSVELSRRNLLLAAGGLGLAHLAGWGGGVFASRPRTSFVSSPVWRPFSKSAAPLLIVFGDYYIFGDTDETGQVLRLTREFFINSRDDLYRYMMENDHLHYRYMDLDLRYAPTAVATALRDLAPLIADRPTALTIGASQLTPQLLRDHDIVYVGYLSGLGVLAQPAFRGGRIGLGQGFDQLLDRRTGKTYDSEAAIAPPPRGQIRDYGYFTRFPGPGGNTITVIAGARDIALSGVAEAAVSVEALRALPRLSDDQAFEALYQVEGQGGASLKARLLIADRRDATTLWSTVQGS